MDNPPFSTYRGELVQVSGKKRATFERFY